MLNKQFCVNLSSLVNELSESMTNAELIECTTLLEISETIEKKRRSLGLSQKKLAEKMNVSQSMVSKWESGDYNFSIKVLSQIADILDLDLINPLSYVQTDMFKFGHLSFNGGNNKKNPSKPSTSYDLIGGAA